MAKKGPSEFEVRKAQANAESIMDYKRKEFSPAEINHARAVVAANAQCAEDDVPRCAEDARCLLESLGLMPGQGDWYYTDQDPLTPRPKEKNG